MSFELRSYKIPDNLPPLYSDASLTRPLLCLHKQRLNDNCMVVLKFRAVIEKCGNISKYRCFCSIDSIKLRELFVMFSNLNDKWVFYRERTVESTVLTGCEMEIQELMKQIDGTISAQKIEWQNKLQAANNKLSLKEQEFLIQKTTIEQKNAEVSNCVWTDIGIRAISIE